MPYKSGTAFRRALEDRPGMNMRDDDDEGEEKSP